MSTRQVHYVVCGVCFTGETLNGLNKFNPDWYEDTIIKLEQTEINKYKSYELIYDGMNADFVVFGKVIQKGDEEGLEFLIHSEFEPSFDETKSIVALANDLFGADFFRYMDFDTFVFTLWV